MHAHFLARLGTDQDRQLVVRFHGEPAEVLEEF